MISFFTYIILTYFSINFIFWLFNINKAQDEIKDDELFNNQNLKNQNQTLEIKPAPSNEDIKLKDLLVEDDKRKKSKFKKDFNFKNIYKKHLTVCVKNL